jgi:hypothetical protein
MLRTPLSLVRFSGRKMGSECFRGGLHENFASNPKQTAVFHDGL